MSKEINKKQRSFLQKLFNLGKSDEEYARNQVTKRQHKKDTPEDTLNDEKRKIDRVRSTTRLY